MELKLEKASGKAKCRNNSYQKNPKYISPKGRIKNGTTCVCVIMEVAGGLAYGYYCRDCIDEIYIRMKTILNPNLWSFI